MTQQTNQRKKGESKIVVQLDDYRTGAQPVDPERAAAISRWHLDQASGPSTAAMLNISIGANGAPQVTAIGIEPEHALAMLSTIDGVAVRLTNIAGAPALYINRTIAEQPLIQAVSRGLRSGT